MEGVATRRATLAASRATAPLPKFRGPEQLPPRLPGFSAAGEPLIGLPSTPCSRAPRATRAALALRAASSAWRYRVNFLSPRLRPALGGDLERSLESLRRATETLPTAKALRFSERRPGCLNVLLAIDVDDARAVAARADDFDAAHALLADELEADRGIAAARRVRERRARRGARGDVWTSRWLSESVASNLVPCQARCYAMDRSFAASAVRVWAAAALALRRSLDVEACGRLRNHAILDALVVLHSRHGGILPSPRRVRRAPPLRAYLESSRRGVLGQRCPAPPEDLTALDPLVPRYDLADGEHRDDESAYESSYAGSDAGFGPGPAGPGLFDDSHTICTPGGVSAGGESFSLGRGEYVTAPLRSTTAAGADRFVAAPVSLDAPDGFGSTVRSLGSLTAANSTWASGSHRRCVLDRPATTSSLSRLSGGKFENPTVDSIYDSAHHAYRTYRSMRMDGRAAFDLCLKERLAFVGDHGNPARQSFDVAESAEKARLPSVLHLPEPASHELPAPPGHRPSTIKRMGAAIDRVWPEAPPPEFPAERGLVEADAPLYRKPLSTILNMLVRALIVLGSACVAADDAYAAPDAPTVEFSPVVPSRVSPSNPFTLEALVRTGGAAATIEWSADVDDAALLTRRRAVVDAGYEAVARGAASDDDVRALREGLVAHLLFIAEHEQPLKIFEVNRQAACVAVLTEDADQLGDGSQASALTVVSLVSEWSARKGVVSGTAPGIFDALAALLGAGALETESGDICADRGFPGAKVTRCASEEFAFASAIDDLGVALAKDLVPGEEPAAVASPGAALRVARVETADAVDVDFAASDEPGRRPRACRRPGRRRDAVDVAAAELDANSRPTLPARVDTRVVRVTTARFPDAAVPGAARRLRGGRAPTLVVTVRRSARSSPGTTSSRSTARRPTRPPPAGARRRRRRGPGPARSPATLARRSALLAGDDGDVPAVRNGAADWDAEACAATASTADATACECPAIDGGADYAATTNQEAQLAYVRRSFADPLDKKLATSSIPLVKLGGDRRLGGAAEDAYKEKSRQAHVLGLRASLPVAVAKGPVGRERAGGLPLLSLAIESVKLRHPWLSVFYVYDARRSRAARAALALLDTLGIIFFTAIVYWFQNPSGLCEAQDDESSCENVRSSAAFGAEKMCAWDPDYDDACHFREPNDTKAFLLDLEEAFFCVLLVLPFIQLVDYVSERYLFAPLAGQGSARDDRAARDARAAKDAGRRLFDNLGRREIEDALGDATTGDDAAALRRLLAAHGAFWSLAAAARWGGGLGDADAAARHVALARLQYAGALRHPVESALFTAQGRHGFAAGDGFGDLHRAPAAPAPRAAKVAVAVALGLARARVAPPTADATPSPRSSARTCCPGASRARRGRAAPRSPSPARGAAARCPEGRLAPAEAPSVASVAASLPALRAEADRDAGGDRRDPGVDDATARRRANRAHREVAGWSRGRRGRRWRWPGRRPGP
ncbi:hypothetical protein JL720_15152 [Aureococcus anophagefferens]|nr:hypothetical protein JL720_15152 [Aureococcus anophagefferens]